MPGCFRISAWRRTRLWSAHEPLADDPAHARVSLLARYRSLLDRRPGQLSAASGNGSRSAATVVQTKILLLDEPWSLDEGRKTETCPTRAAARRGQHTMVYVSHDAAELRQLATQICDAAARTGDGVRRREGVSGTDSPA